MRSCVRSLSPVLPLFVYHVFNPVTLHASADWVSPSNITIERKTTNLFFTKNTIPFCDFAETHVSTLNHFLSRDAVEYTAAIYARKKKKIIIITAREMYHSLFSLSSFHSRRGETKTRLRNEVFRFVSRAFLKNWHLCRIFILKSCAICP